MSKHTHALTCALIYCRVSSEDQATNGLSLPVQLQECRRYVSYQDGWVIGSEYEDVMSGKRDDRPAYQALLAEAKRLRSDGHRVVILVAALDRLGRDIHERVRVWKDLNPEGVEFHSCRDGGLVSEFTFNILASVAREETRRLGERVARVQDAVRQNGWKVPGKVAVGYAWRPATEDERKLGAPASVLVVNPVTAATVREAYQRVADGASVRQVARWVAGLPSDQRGGLKLSLRAVQQMLAAPVYVARSDQGDEDVLARPVCHWEPLVSDTTWQAVQDRTASHGRRPRQASGRYLLSGSLWCGACGRRMVGGGSPVGRTRKDGSKSKSVYRRYRCTGAVLGAGDVSHCDAAFGTVGLDALVTERVMPILALAVADPEVRLAVRQAWRELVRASQPDPGHRARIASLERTAQKARERLKQGALLLVDGSLDKDGYQAVKAQAEADLNSADAEAARLRGVKQAPTLPTADEALAMLDNLAVTWANGTTESQRAVLAVLVERIVPERISQGKYDISITWTAEGDAFRRLVADAA